MGRNAKTPYLAKDLVPKLARALRKPGLSRVTIFGDPPNPKLYAYSVDLNDVTKVVRTSFSGERESGQFDKAGRFVPSK